MKESDDELAQRLNSLHRNIENLLTDSKKASIQIGEGLFYKKNEMSQREFTAWIQSCLEFNEIAVKKYLEIFRKIEMDRWQGFNY